MTTDSDLTPYLFDLTPDPAAIQNARTFAARFHPMPLQSVGSLVMCFASFHNDYARPGLPAGLSEVVAALSFAASGLFALLEDDHRPGDSLDTARLKEWKTLTRARLWAVETLAGAAAALTSDEVGEGGHAAARPHLLPTWATSMRHAGREREAGHFAAWYTVAHLLEAAPTLEDGEAEGFTSALLSAFSPEGGPGFDLPALTLSPSMAGLPFPAPLGGPDFDPVYTAQYVEVLEGGRVRVCMGGGEDYETNAAACRLTPLPDGAAFLVLIVEGQPLTIRLTPEDTRMVCQVFEWKNDEEGKPTSPLN